MGTRNLTCVQVNDKIKVAKYCQWDGYPSGQGKTIINFILNDFDKDVFLKKLRFVRKITDKEMKDAYISVGIDPKSEWINLEQANRFKEAYPYLDRDMGGDILLFIQNLDDKIALSYDKDFALDGLFCEWCWVLNLDKDSLDVYSGFSEVAETSIFCPTIEEAEKHKHVCTDTTYYPVVKIDSIPFCYIRMFPDSIIDRINQCYESFEKKYKCTTK